MERKIRVGLTHGDINGVGYEVLLKVFADDAITELCTPILFGSPKPAAYYRKAADAEDLKLTQVSTGADAKEGCVNLVNVLRREYTIEPGKPTKDSGQAAIASLQAAVESLRRGEIDVLVTAPVSKEAMKMAGFPHTGHTEYLEAEAAEGCRATMMFTDDNLRVALLTTHLPMDEVAASVTREAVAAKLRDMDSLLRRDFRCTRPLIAVLALNPHAGDGGLLGSQEATEIIPAIEDAGKEGVMAFGPYPADGFFGSGMWRKFDAVLAMYHDQGLVGFKALSGPEGVNVTCGLDFVRTSPDHGTGYDIAGKGVADPTSMRHAIFTAIDIYRARKSFEEATANPLRHRAPEKGERRRQSKHADADARRDAPRRDAETAAEEEAANLNKQQEQED